MTEFRLVNPTTIRWLTALVVVAMCFWSIWLGVGIVQFSIAKSKSDALEPWFKVPGLAFAAQEAALPLANDSGGDRVIQIRRDDLAEILATGPLTSYYWAQLADARAEAHDALPEVIGALELSFITGPNEDYVMVQRGMFGIWVWEKLPAEYRERTAANLAESQISDEKATWLRETLSEKTAQVRQDIRSALLAHGLTDAKLERIGL